ncbi:14749_t:CDS:2, partial [Entrophospora sp. SA101]
ANFINIMDKKCNIEEELQYGVKIIPELNACNKTLRVDQLKQNKKWDQERKQWDRERNKWGQKLGGANTEIQKSRTHDLELINETRSLQIENTRKDISLAESKAKYATKLEEIKSLQNEMKLLKGKLDLSQKDSSKKGSEIMSLKSKIVELALKISELERLKSEDISGSIGSVSPTIIGRDDEKNITKSDDISLDSTDLSKYFICGKNMDPIGKIDGNMCLESKTHGFATDTSFAISTYTNGEITELSKNDTEIIPKVSDEINISKNSNNILQEIPNMTPYLTQPENNISSLIESHSQILIGGIEVIEVMRPSLEALPLPVMASTLMSPLLAYIFLTLLIIAVMWFVILRCACRVCIHGYHPSMRPAQHMQLVIPDVIRNKCTEFVENFSNDDLNDLSLKYRHNNSWKESEEDLVGIVEEIFKA